MYGVKAFESWSSILLGGALFAGLFTVVALLTEAIFSGKLEFTGWVLSVAATSFVGYLGVAHFLRHVDERN